jgi:hypothetical protein
VRRAIRFAPWEIFDDYRVSLREDKAEVMVVAKELTDQFRRLVAATRK